MSDLAPAPAPKSKRKRNLILAAMAVAAAIGGGVFWYLRHGRESTDDAQIDSDVVLVPARTGGVITVVFTENQRVKAGDVIAEIDDEALAAKLKQADAALVQAKANADAADANAALAERNAVGNQSAAKASLSGASMGEKTNAAQLAEGQASLTSAEATLAQAKLDADRDRALAQNSAIPRTQLEQTETKLRIAQSNVDLAKARIATLQSAVGAARSKIEEASARAAQSSDVTNTVRLARAQADAAKAQVEVATALRKLAELDHSYAKIRAPQDGVMSKKAIAIGALVVPGQAVGQLVTDGRWVTANYKETQVGKMHTGQPVKITVDAFDITLHGEVESLSSGTGSRFTLLPPDNATGNFTKVVQRVPVRIKLTDVPKDLILRTGMNVEATVDVRDL